MSDYSVSFSLGGEPGTMASATQEPKIEFLCDPDLFDHIPHPQSAIRFAPPWFKALEREMGGVDAHGLPQLSAKACVPMTDAFSLGFVIPLPMEIEFTIPENRIEIELAWETELSFEPISQHHPRQIGAPNPPFERTVPLKFMNPWRIKVPPGYSILFVQPLSRPDLPFTCFSGLVDCDRFETTVNFPFAWTGPAGEHVLPAGTAMAQLIPIKRDSLIKRGAARPATEDEQRAEAEARHRKYTVESTYAREWRVKK